MAEIITATARDCDESPMGAIIDVSGHRIVGDEPEAMGGRNLGPSPFDLVTAALAECTALTVRWYAAQKNWPLDHVHVVVEHSREAVEGHAGRIDTFRKVVKLEGAALSEDQKERLQSVAGRCPVQKLLEGPVAITTLAG